MQLPAALRQGVDTALADIPLRDLADAVQILSERYRRGRRDGAPHLSSDLAACAYLATRLPATFAAIAAAFDALAEVRPDFAPRSLLDVGAGPGTAMWAAAERWPIADARLVECSGAIRALGQALAMSAPVARIAWDDADLARGLPSGEKCDLVVVAYVLNELEQDAADRVIDSAWHRSSDTLVVVEPGTPAGWRRMLQVRARVLAAGAHVLAPCPHAGECPLEEPDWCHFSRKVARSRLHRMAKDATVPWEEEKFIYLAVSRHDPASQNHPASRHDPAPRHDPSSLPPRLDGPSARVLGPPKTASGRVSLKLCQRDGSAATRLFTRRAGEAYRVARRLDWGDAWPAQTPPAR